MPKTYTALAFRVTNIGNAGDPEWTRAGHFIEIQRTKDKKFKGWTPEFGKLIPTELIVDPVANEEYFFVQQPMGDIKDILALLTFSEEKFEAETILSNRIADFCIDILNSSLGPPPPPK